MCLQCVVGHQLHSDLFGQGRIQPAANVDRREFFVFTFAVGMQFMALFLQFGVLAIGLGVHRHVFARRHRHRPGNQPGAASHQDSGVTGMRRRHAEHQAGGRDDAVIRAEYGRAQPANMAGAMSLGMA
jgi:hypothetical protein